VKYILILLHQAGVFQLSLWCTEPRNWNRDF